MDFQHLPLGCDGGSDGLLEYTPDLERGAYTEIDFAGALNAARDPLAALRRARGWLAPGGTVRARFDNARHIATIGALVSGKWPRGVIGDEGQLTKEQWQRPGILTNSATEMTDANPKSKPLRFFTRREIGRRSRASPASDESKCGTG